MKKPTCPTCGSDNVVVKGYLKWSPKSRRFLPHTIHDEWDCADCAPKQVERDRRLEAEYRAGLMAVQKTYFGFEGAPAGGMGYPTPLQPVWVETD
jgi:transposase-like protein